MRIARRERIVVALKGFNGLRRVELLRLRERDCFLDSLPPQLLALGKGRNGGRRRTIPMSAHAYPAVADWIAARQWVGQGKNKDGDTFLYPWNPRTADHDVRAAGVRTSIGPMVSGHDLRRSFARISYQNGMPLVVLKNRLGHASTEMTCHYVGADASAMATELGRFAGSTP